MLNKRIKALRLKKNLTQKELANKLNLTPKMVSFYELGERVPPTDALEKLADIFGVTTDYLLCRTGFITCPVCYNTYDPLNESDSKQHIEFHNRFIKAQKIFGRIPIYEEAHKIRTSLIADINNAHLSINEREDAFEKCLKMEYVIVLWENGFNVNNESFQDFCKKEMGLSDIKEALVGISEETYQKFVEKYGIANEEEYHKPTISAFKNISVKELNTYDFSIIEEIHKMNERGKSKILETVKEMNCSPLYNDDYLEAIAAHERTDIKVTDEMKKHDDDIMDNDDNWS